MKNIVYTILGIILIQSLTSCGQKDQSNTNVTEAISVKVSKVSSGDNLSFVNASGQIEAVNSATLSTRMMGFVTKLHVKVGDKIKKNQLLLNINNTDLQAKKAQVEASIIQAKAGYENAKKDYHRFVTLFDQGSASQKELDDMTTRFHVAEAGLKAAQQMKNEIEAQFSYTAIRAPYAGVVTNTFIKEGDMANPGVPLISIESAGLQQAVVRVSEGNIDMIKEGMDASILVKSIGHELTGKVSEVSTSAKLTGGQYQVKLIITDTDPSVLSGMYVNVRFPVETSLTSEASRVMVPESSLIKQGQLTGIYTVGSEQTAILRWLRTGTQYGDQVEVLSGLSQDESYIISAEGRLYNGAKVTVN